MDALLESLDALKPLKENLASGDEGEVDIQPLIAALREVADPAPEQEAIAPMGAVVSGSGRY